MNSKQAYQIHADICRALTHPLRLEIIDRLRNGEKCVTHLIAELAAPQTTVSRHLRILRTAGIVLTRRQGMNVYYRLSSPRVVAAYDEMHQFTVEHFAEQSELFADESGATDLNRAAPIPTDEIRPVDDSVSTISGATLSEQAISKDSTFVVQ